MCGLLGFWTSDGTAADAVVDLTGIGHGTACVKCGPDEPGTRHDEQSPGFSNRLSINDTRDFASAAALGTSGQPGPLRNGLQRRDLQLSELRAELACDEGAVFRTEGDGEAIVAAVPSLGAGFGAPAGAGCSRSRSGTPPTTPLFIAPRPVRHRRCSSRPDPGAPRSGSEKKSLWS